MKYYASCIPSLWNKNKIEEIFLRSLTEASAVQCSNEYRAPLHNRDHGDIPVHRFFINRSASFQQKLKYKHPKIQPLYVPKLKRQFVRVLLSKI